MIKILHSILIILFVFISMITKSISSDISTILRNQQLTVFDIGLSSGFPPGGPVQMSLFKFRDLVGELGGEILALRRIIAQVN